MSEADLQAVGSALTAIPGDAVRKPTVPVEVYCHQGERIWEAVKRDREAIIAVGIGADVVDSLPARLGALRTADAEWQVRKKRGRPEDQVKREAAGFLSRNEAAATARFGLRGDARAQEVLDEVQKGDGLADMLDDMEKLSVLYRENHAGFRLPGFDARAEATRLESEAAAIRAGSAAWRVEESSDTLKDRRDRAFTYADMAIDEVRAGARFAFRGDRDDRRMAPYVDTYSAETNRRSRASRGEKKATAASAAHSAGTGSAASTGPAGQSPK